MRAARPILLFTVLLLAACGAPQRYGAAEDVQAFFKAVQTGDEAAFERHIDREAVREDLKQQLAESGMGGDNAALLGALLGGGGADRLIDGMITPQNFQLAAQGAGLADQRIPTAVELSALLHMQGENRACLRNTGDDDCAMTFEKQGETWKLVGVRTGAVQVKVPDSARG